VAKAVSHATVQEIWNVVAGAGEMWRRQNSHEHTVTLQPGVCLTIPVGTVFQFRAAEGDYPLENASQSCVRSRFGGRLPDDTS
jgi:mannose-6-phosphate isomerase-like protein (cupin superfamily)